MTRPRLGVATCRERPEPQPDDLLMLQRLERVELVTAPWDDPGAPWAECNAVLLRSVWDYHLRLDAFMAWIGGLEAAGTPVWNPPSLVRWNARKSYLLELEARGVPIVPTRALTAEKSLGEWRRAIRESAWSEVVLKPLVGASSYLTWRSTATEASRREDRLERLRAHGGALLQPFVPEVESAGEWSLIFFAGVFSHAVLKRARAGEFRVQSEFGGSVELLPPPEPALRAAAAAVAAAPASEPALYARVDLVESEGRFLLGELELIEPAMFLDLEPAAPNRFARAVRRYLDR